MRRAEARRQASTITSNSIRLSLVGGQVGCTMNTSRPRTFSLISTLTSPSLNRPTLARPTGKCRWRAMSCANAGLALPLNSARVSASTIRVPSVASCPIAVPRIVHWLGWEDSNLRMAGSKPAALPLGDTPVVAARNHLRDTRGLSAALGTPMLIQTSATASAAAAAADAAASD